MKLPHQRKYAYGIHRHFPLFSPAQCTQCECDVKYEWMWHFVSGPWIGGAGCHRYLCTDCVPTKKAAHVYACEFSVRNLPPGKVLVPPPPPPSVKK